jgi:hypothetical protein
VGSAGGVVTGGAMGSTGAALSLCGLLGSSFLMLGVDDLLRKAFARCVMAASTLDCCLTRA